MGGKVSIIGAGNVGMASAFAIAMDGTPSEVVLFDCNIAKAQGEVMDIEHASSFLEHTRFRATEEYADITDSDIVVITAGARQAEGETRLDLLERNLGILYSIIEGVKRYAPEGIIVMVTNPVDILTHFAQVFSGFDRSRVIGTGTVLDTSRYRSFIAKEYNVAPRNIEVFVLGEHGDSSFPALSVADIGSMPLKKVDGYSAKRMKELHKDVVQAAYDVIDRKGHTNLAIGVCVRQIVCAILRDSHEVLPVSSVLEGEYGLHDIALSTPSIITRNGIVQWLELPLNRTEKGQLKKSARILKKHIAQQEKKNFKNGQWCPVA